MSSAAAITDASEGLVSNECGSVFGLLSMAVTRTYLPPICEITFAYSFSAPTAVTAPVVAVAVSLAPLEEQAAARPVTAVRAMAMSIRRPGMRRLLKWGLSWGTRAPPPADAGQQGGPRSLLLMK